MREHTDQAPVRPSLRGYCPQWLGTLAVLAIILGFAAAPQRAHADEIGSSAVLDKSVFVYSSQTNRFSFDAPAAGTLSVHLFDLSWPERLQDLSCSILSPHSVLGSIGSEGEFDVQLATAGTFYAYIMGLAGNTLGLQAGMYSLHIDFTPLAPVPLPEALRLLLVGLGLVAGVRLLWTRAARSNESVMSVA